MNIKTFRGFALCLGVLSFFALIQGGAQAQVKSWSQSSNSAQRFVSLSEFGNEAVLDRTTGLIWEKNAQSTNVDWETARRGCLAHSHPSMGSFGWRLPKFEEFGSLYAAGNTSPGGLLVSLPSGHPFTGNTSGRFWTASESTDGASARVFDGNVYDNNFETKNNAGSSIWCVRGGAN